MKLIRKEIAQPLEHLFTEALKKNRTVRKNNIRCFINKEWKNINIVIDPIFNNSVRFRSYFVLFETSGVFAEVKSSGAGFSKRHGETN
ncbi:MAG: hypothetical protein IPL53_10385 [Ignavibacteria bacterium]|nr:hypothetical protein [Ignavibacteria bacterium]